VSEDAIRRDLRARAAEGRCRRVYGGALPIYPATATMAARLGEGMERKRLLARAAALTIEPGEFLFLDSSTTNLALVEFLPEDRELTVATNSIEIAAALLRRQDLRLIMVGGLADPVVGGCVDSGAVQTVAQMRFDRAFLGVCAVSVEEGVGAFDVADAAFKRAVVASARRTLVLAISEKFGDLALHRVAPLSRIDTLVVEADIPPAPRAAFEAAGCRLLVAAP
jgi:DeoR/GlpR family transcriptional regulator of sugar metabolism